MSDLQLINTHSPEWRAIEALITKRIAALTEVAMSPTLSDQQRRDNVMRADELALLMRAPGEIRDQVVRHTGAVPPRSMY